MDSGEIAGSPAPFDGEIGYIDIASVAPGRISKTTTYDFAMHRAGPAVSYFTVTSFGRRASELRVACRHWQPASNLIASTGFAVITPKTLPTAFLYETITTSCRRATTAMPEISEFRFASDSPLEGDGFEPSVPRQIFSAARTCAIEPRALRQAEQWINARRIEWEHPPRRVGRVPENPGNQRRLWWQVIEAKKDAAARQPSGSSNNWDLSWIFAHGCRESGPFHVGSTMEGPGAPRQRKNGRATTDKTNQHVIAGRNSYGRRGSCSCRDPYRPQWRGCYRI